MSGKRRAERIEQRDFLLDSLEDLEAERAAGDIDVEDYRQLRDDYTVRAADLIRQIDSESVPASSTTQRRPRRLLWVVGLLVFAVLAGVLLAQTAGERGVGDELTGSIEESVRTQVLRCQQLGTDPGRLIESLECFDEVLDRDPDNLEALSYRGWYLVLASGDAQQAGEEESAGELRRAGLGFLDRAVAIDPTFPDARAFRAIVFDRAGDADAACGELAALAANGAPPMIEQLTLPLGERLGC